MMGALATFQQSEPLGMGLMLWNSRPVDRLIFMSQYQSSSMGAASQQEGRCNG